MGTVSHQVRFKCLVRVGSMWLNLSRCSIQTKPPRFFSFIPRPFRSELAEARSREVISASSGVFRVSDLN
jgi:hypothetical protein